MVKAEILYEDDEKIRILLKDTDRAFVNSIRTVSYTHLTLPTKRIV